MSTPDAAGGPFRRGARVVIATQSLGTEELSRAVREVTRGTIPSALSVASMGVATIALGAFLGGIAYLAVASGVVILALTPALQLWLAARAKPFPARPVELSEHGLALEADGRRSLWPWRVVRAVHVAPSASWIDVGAQGWLALSRDPRVDEALAALPRGSVASGRRTLQWLALAYIAITLALGLLLPQWIGPPSPLSPSPLFPSAETIEPLLESPD